MNIGRLARRAAPFVLDEIRWAHKQLADVHPRSRLRPWLSALSPALRQALREANFELLPPDLRRELDLVVDVGANKGHWIAALLRIVPVKHAFVFEPNPVAMSECRQRLAGRSGIEFKEVALGAERGSAVLHVYASSDFSSLLKPQQQFIAGNYTNDAVRSVAERTVDVFPLDELLPPGRIDLLKLDVQGFERQVLAGARRSLTRIRAVLVETNFQSHYAGDDTFDTLFQLFTRELGFALWDISSAYHGKTGQALWADALFVNPRLAPLSR